MREFVRLSIRETNLLRKSLSRLAELRDEFLKRPGKETVHDLRVCSRRVRELLAYMGDALPDNLSANMRSPARKITTCLGRLRETEVNLKLCEHLSEEQLILPLAAELVTHKLTKRKRKLEQRVKRQLKAGNFQSYSKFLVRLKGSRTLPLASGSEFWRRSEEFYSFQVPEDMNDSQLHELRILTKKLRYATEIHGRLSNQRFGRFILRLKRLQELLGDIHDLFVFLTLLNEETASWNTPGLKIIPETLQEATRVTIQQKEKLYSRVKVLHQRILENTPAGVRRDAVGLKRPSKPDYSGIVKPATA